MPDDAVSVLGDPLAQPLSVRRGGADLALRRELLETGPAFDTVLRGPGSVLEPMLRRARRIATFDVPVLMRGAPGTGKAALAAALHAGSLRRGQPFLTLDCAGLSEADCAAALFGMRQAPPPARFGLLERADRRTLYLACVDSLSPVMQRALVRLLAEGLFAPIGGGVPQQTAVRVIAGAETDLSVALAEGRLRRDLYDALAVTELYLPGLSARRGELPYLAAACLREAALRHGKPADRIAPEALAVLEAHDWPGNLPELRNEVTRMLILAEGPELGADLISRHILRAPDCAPDSGPARGPGGAAGGSLKARVEQIERCILRETLERLDWNKSHAADALGLSRVGLRAKLERYGIAPGV